MGAFLDKPRIEKETCSGSGNKMYFGLSSMQGWRIEMEDAHIAQVSMTKWSPNMSDWAFYAVFDGHAGAKVSKHCAEELLTTIEMSLKKSNFDPNSYTPEQIAKAVKDGFELMDEQLRTECGDEDRSGTTATCALVSPKHVFLLNCGDSRSLFCLNDRVEMSTHDHKPNDDIERNRIQQAGGTVMLQRVNGSLAVSRALGDFEYKNVPNKKFNQQMVSPEPDIIFRDRTDKDQFIFLACDGIWDVRSNENICDYVTHQLKVTDDLVSICNTILDACLHLGSRDNMSAILVTFPGAPSIDPAAVEKDKEFDEKLISKATYILENDKKVCCTVGQLFNLLKSELPDDAEDYPPGLGLYAKYSKLNTLFRSMRRTDSVEEDEENGGGSSLIASLKADLESSS